MKTKRESNQQAMQWSHHIIIDVALATHIEHPTKSITLHSKSSLYANERLLSHGMAYNASDTSLRSLHTALVASPLTRFRVPDRREYIANTMKGTSVVECRSLKLSSTNVKLDTVQTSICLGIGGKLLETLRQLIEEWYAPYIQCTVNENKDMNILFHFRQELDTCAECKPTSIARTFETSLREARVG